MKVLWITANFHPQLGGLEIYTDRAVGSLAEVCEVHLVTQGGQGPPSVVRVGHSRVANLGRPNSEPQWQEARRTLREQVLAFAPEIVHFANAGVAVYRDTIPQGIPVVATVHGNDLTAPWQWVPGCDARERIVESLRGCDRIFAVSSHTQALIQQAGVDAPVQVIAAGCDTGFFRRMPVDVEEVRERYGVAPGAAIVLTVGRLVERKGHLTVLDALRQVPAAAHWIVVGDGPGRKGLREAVSRSPVRDRVTLVHGLKDDELLELYNACSLFVLTPEERRSGDRIDSEGFGLVFQEAGACGKPVIASDLSGCRDAVVDGATGLLVPPADPAAVAAAIESLLSDPGLAARLGAAAEAMIRGAGGWPRFARQTVDHYHEVLGDG